MSYETINFDDAVEWADYVLENTDGPNGMMMTWRNEAAKRTATWTMLMKIKEAYELALEKNA